MLNSATQFKLWAPEVRDSLWHADKQGKHEPSLCSFWVKPSRDSYHVSLWWWRCVSAGDHCLRTVDVILCLLQIHTQTLPLITLRLLFITPYVFITDSPLSSYIKDSLKIIVTVHLLHSLKANNYILIWHLWASLREKSRLWRWMKIPTRFHNPH